MNIGSLMRNLGILLIGISCLLFSLFRHDYELLQLGDMVRDQYLIDKKTGRVWQKVCDGDVKAPVGCDGVLIWHEMYVVDLTPEDSRPALVYKYLVNERSKNE